jgi:6-phosphofructokinase 1
MDTAHKVSQISRKLGFPVQCLGIPKTVDNDLPITDNCPGFGSVAKYVAVSTQEAALDVLSMAKTSTKVFILEVMGRHAGWIAAAGGLAGTRPEDPPHIILFPEVPFQKRAFLKRVRESVAKYDYCVIVVSEGARYKNGKFQPWTQVPLRGSRLPATFGTAHRIGYGREAGLRRRQGRRRVRAGGQDRDHASDQARF